MSPPAGGQTRRSYDAVAGEYAARISGELAGKPKDRELLDTFADSMRGKGRVADIGCGPGHVARYLKDRGADVFGVDLSPAMVDQARRRQPDIEFRIGDMAALDLPDGALAGILLFYSLIHVPPAEVVRALRELRRTLRPDGLLFLAFHVGEQTLHLDEWWGERVSVDFHFFTTAWITRALRAAGFEVEQVAERDPYPEVEHQSRRAYVLARRRAGPRLKVCCMASVGEMRAAVAAGASAVGLVSEMPSGPGVIPEPLIAEIAAATPPGVDTFLLTCNQDVDAIAGQQRRTRVTTIQICDDLAAGAHERLREAVPGITLVQVVHVDGDAAIARAAAVAPHVDAILLDSGNQALAVKELGGTGRRHDWSISRRIRDAVGVPAVSRRRAARGQRRGGDRDRGPLRPRRLQRGAHRRPAGSREVGRVRAGGGDPTG